MVTFDYEKYGLDEEQNIRNLAIEYSGFRLCCKNRAFDILRTRIATKTQSGAQKQRLKFLGECATEFNAHLGDGTIFT